MYKVAPVQESYVMQGGSLQGGQGVVRDGVDEVHPVSIHVSGGAMGLQHDSGPVTQDSHPSGQSEVNKKNCYMNIKYQNSLDIKFDVSKEIHLTQRKW